MTKHRTIFYLSDRTGITAETLGHALITQFDTMNWAKKNVPFINSDKKVQKIVEQINAASERDGLPPLVFSTMINVEYRESIKQASCCFYDFFESFIGDLEKDLGQPSSHAIGRSHGIDASSSYLKRIQALNFSLNHDDGATLSGFKDADIILTGASRTGKTPTCLFLSLQYGIAAANYPLTEEDMESQSLPKLLQPHKDKLYGLTINASQLHKIRCERRPNSRYASLTQCRAEIRWQEDLFSEESIPFLDTTSVSIEEIATTILHQAKLKRRLYG